MELHLEEIKKRINLVRFFPVFSNFSEAQLNELVLSMSEIILEKNKILVSEKELVDSIYFIISGKAEVSKELMVGKKKQLVPIAKLREGEGIGITDTGFFSKSGHRTASVISLTPMVLLKLDLKKLDHFLRKHHLEKRFFEQSAQMLKMLFIKQSLPFSKISPERLKWLAEKIKEVVIPKDEIIFKQGDRGDCCYLIKSGLVEIIAQQESEKKKIAKLHSPALFGEATLITKSPRNATAIALEETILFVLDQKDLSELLETEAHVAAMFMTLMIDRSRPARNPEISVHSRLTDDKQEIIILKNKINDKYFKLSKEGNFIWKQLDGRHTLQEITLDLAKEYNIFAPDMVVALISKLTKAGFIANLGFTKKTQQAKPPLWAITIEQIRRILEFRYAVSNADELMNFLYQKFFKIFFTKVSNIIFMLIIFLGFLAFIYSTTPTIHFFKEKQVSLWLFIALIPLSIAEIIFHELGHAMAVKAFGREVNYMGIGWYWFGPIAFTDTSDMWLTTRKPRMLVNLAGVYVDLVIAGFVSLLLFVIEQPYIECTLWLFALYTYINGFRRLSPLQEMDGYYVLMDWVEKNRLQQSAILWLIRTLPRCLRKPILFKNYWPEIMFWISSICYLTLITLLAFTVQYLIFDILNIKGNPFLSLIIPFVILILTSLSIIAQIKNQSEL